MLTHLEYHNCHFKMNARLAAVPLHLNDDPSFLEDTGKAPNPITVSLVLGDVWAQVELARRFF